MALIMRPWQHCLKYSNTEIKQQLRLIMADIQGGWEAETTSSWMSDGKLEAGTAHQESNFLGSGICRANANKAECPSVSSYFHISISLAIQSSSSSYLSKFLFKAPLATWRKSYPQRFWPFSPPPLPEWPSPKKPVRISSFDGTPI